MGSGMDHLRTFTIKVAEEIISVSQCTCMTVSEGSDRVCQRNIMANVEGNLIVSNSPTSLHSPLFSSKIIIIIS